MEMSFTGHHVEITPALRAYTEKKLGKLSHHFSQHMTMRVVYVVEKLMHVVEATVRVSHAEFHARAEAMDMYAAVDALEEKLNHQLMAHKGKQQDN